MHPPANLLTDVPAADLPGELVQTLLSGDGGFRVERIVSTGGHASLEQFWYDQAQHEWVLLVSGAARLRFEGADEPVDLVPGSYLDIPAHTRHRVEWTDPTRVTVWLAIHYSEPTTHC
jgi:cupin 2 domain-containing protein